MFILEVFILIFVKIVSATWKASKRKWKGKWEKLGGGVWWWWWPKFDKCFSLRVYRVLLVFYLMFCGRSLSR